jgi:uncharacterized membrane protein YtjA (UPF0391 family)
MPDHPDRIGQKQPALPGHRGPGRWNQTAPPPVDRFGGFAMSLLKWALIMLLVSLVAALLGFTDLSAASADVARVLFYIFGIIFLVLLVLGLAGMRAARGP